MKLYSWKCPLCGLRGLMPKPVLDTTPICRGTEDKIHASTKCVRDYKADAVNVQAVR
jgi:hypothetical protein